MSKEIDLNGKTVLISRTDSIGDVILTLPMCAWLKQSFPKVKILFLGRKYTEAIISTHASIDKFLDWNAFESQPLQQRISKIKEEKIDVFIHVFPNKEVAKIAKKAKISIRIGTSHRSFHYLTCNIRPSFTRSKSNKHEAQLNFQLLKTYNLTELPELTDIIKLNKQFNKIAPITETLKLLLNKSEDKPRIVLHAKSQGSALEWGLDNFTKLAKQLSNNGFAVYYTGTEKEGAQLRGTIPTGDSIFDVTGKMSLSELVSFINECDGLVACSTGPLHIAATLNKKTIGLYSSRRPIHPGRWKPVGEKAIALVNDENCQACAKGEMCDCIQNIAVERVLKEIID